MQLRTDNIIDENSLIEKCAFLSAFKDSQILKIYHLASHLDIKKDEILFDINTNDKSGLFILIDGQITFAKDNEGIVVKNIISGDLFNEHSIFYESKRSYSAKATKDSYVLFVKQDDFIKLTEQDKDIKKTFYEESSKTYNITKLEDIIRRIYGDDIEYDVIKEIVALGEFISLDNDNMSVSYTHLTLPTTPKV